MMIALQYPAMHEWHVTVLYSPSDGSFGRPVASLPLHKSKKMCTLDTSIHMCSHALDDSTDLLTDPLVNKRPHCPPQTPEDVGHVDKEEAVHPLGVMSLQGQYKRNLR